MLLVKVAITDDGPSDPSGMGGSMVMALLPVSGSPSIEQEEEADPLDVFGILFYSTG